MSEDKTVLDNKLIWALVEEAMKESESVGDVTVSQLIPLIRAGYKAGIKAGKKQHIEQMQEAFKKAAEVFRPVY